MDTVRSFAGIDVGAIQACLAKCDAPFEASPLYSTETETNFVNADLRRSVYRTIVDPRLFELVDGVVDEINRGDDAYQYVLWKNGSDITHIKYEEGGFFKRHRDFNSTTSNIIEEFSLIICVTPEAEVAKGVEGGQTAILTFGGVNEDHSERVFDTTTPGSALLFRKDLNHEGMKLVKGQKHIITANLFAVKKDHSEQVLYVTFVESLGTDGIAGKECAKKAIQRASDQNKSYALPVSRLTGTMLEAHMRFSNAKSEANGEDPPPVVTFLCKNFTYEQFGVVARVLNHCYVDEESIKRERECLSYFGPFNVENLLVDLALDRINQMELQVGTKVRIGGLEFAEHNGKSGIVIMASGGRVMVKLEDEKKMLANVKAANLEVVEEGRPQKKHKEEIAADAAAKDVENSDFDTEVIVCENEARMNAVLDVARAFDEPYVPFKILFVEGMLHYYDGDNGVFGAGFDVPMTPAATFIGDYNNVFALWCLDQYHDPGEFSLEIAHKCFPFFQCGPEDHCERILGLDAGTQVDLFSSKDHPSWEIPFEVNCASSNGETGTKTIESEEFLRGGLGLGLNVRASNRELKMGLLKYLFNKHERDSLKPLVLHAGLNGKLDEGDGTLFHLDSHGKACFTRKQAARASDYIAEMKLDQKVKASLQQKKFELPQVSEKVSMVYCNDDRYGKMNVLWVCGVLRLEEDTQVSTKKGKGRVECDTKEQTFDAWPTAEAKEKIQHAKRLASKYEELYEYGCLPERWWEYDSDEKSELTYNEDESEDSEDESDGQE